MENDCEGLLEMIPPEEYNCKEMSECYISYCRRVKREEEQFEQQRTIQQSNEDWIKEYNEGTNLGVIR